MPANLIERIEGATGADREMDCLIWAEHMGLVAEWQGKCLVIDKQVIGSIDPGKIQRNFQCNRSATGPNSIPAYTGSIDIALTLINDDTFFHISRFSPAHEPRCEAHIYPEQQVEAEYVGQGATPALAIVAAALKARGKP